MKCELFNHEKYFRMAVSYAEKEEWFPPDNKGFLKEKNIFDNGHFVIFLNL